MGGGGTRERELCDHFNYYLLQSSGESPPPPVRGPNVRSGEEESEGGGGAEGGAGGGATLSLADLMPKVDISGKITPELIKELADKNWKIRGEALQKVQDIIAAAKFIAPSLGELPSGLKGRLADSNKNLVSCLDATPLDSTHR